MDSRNLMKKIYFFFATMIISFFVLSGCDSTDTGAGQSEQTQEKIEVSAMITLKNDLAEVGFSRENGSITYLKDLARDIEYVSDNKGSVPFRINIKGDLLTEIADFSFIQNGNEIELAWQIREGIKLTGYAALDESGRLSFTSSLENQSETFVLAVEYPVVGHIEKIGVNDALAHPFATGVLFRDPLEAFGQDGQGLRFMPYPESFSGAAMQFFTYYDEGKGGIYCAAYDGDYHQKWLNFYRMDKKLELSMMTGYEDIGAQKGIDTEYPFVIQFTDGNSWYEAAEIYKKWAVEQEWCQKGLQYDIAGNEKALWLLEDVGLTTFGINAGYDRTKWLEKYSEDAGTKIFHVLGPDWSNVDQTFYRGVPGGYRDWFPTKFSRENLEFIKGNGDYFAPFEFDFLVDTAKADGHNLSKNLQIFPEDTYSVDKYAFNMLCPYTEYTKDFHISRDVQVYKEAGVNSMYYDISANNLIKICLNPDHGHPVGGGHVITRAYRDIYIKTQEALNKEAGEYIPLGTEMMCETFIDTLDYYQARAWAQPASALETWPFFSLIRKGQAELIPMFDYVYHEYAPVRMDGWGKMVEEIGDLYYRSAAKIYLWGGLYEINHEYSPMEMLNGETNAADEHYYPFIERKYEYKEERAKYIEQFANLRTGLGNKYLAYGIMQRPAEFTGNAKYSYKWFQYNHTQEYKGKIELGSILHSAYLSPEKDGAALFFANTIGNDASIHVSISPEDYGLFGAVEVSVYTGFARDSQYEKTYTHTFEAAEEMLLEIDLNAYSIYMVEIKNN